MLMSDYCLMHEGLLLFIAGSVFCDFSLILRMLFVTASVVAIATDNAHGVCY